MNGLSATGLASKNHLIQRRYNYRSPLSKRPHSATSKLSPLPTVGSSPQNSLGCMPTGTPSTATATGHAQPVSSPKGLRLAIRQ